MTLQTARFVEANKQSAVVYGGVEGAWVTYRLADGRSFRLPRREAARIGHPRWAHLDPLAEA